MEPKRTHSTSQTNALDNTFSSTSPEEAQQKQSQEKIDLRSLSLEERLNYFRQQQQLHSTELQPQPQPPAKETDNKSPQLDSKFGYVDASYYTQDASQQFGLLTPGLTASGVRTYMELGGKLPHIRDSNQQQDFDARQNTLEHQGEPKTMELGGKLPHIRDSNQQQDFDAQQNALEHQGETKTEEPAVTNGCSQPTDHETYKNLNLTARLAVIRSQYGVDDNEQQISPQKSPPR